MDEDIEAALMRAGSQINALQREVAALRKDAERLVYVYSGRHTGSDALVNIELRLLNGDIPTIQEVRAAIDDAMRTELPFASA